MKKVLRNIGLMLLAIAMLFTGANILGGGIGLANHPPTRQWRVVLSGTVVTTTPNRNTIVTVGPTEHVWQHPSFRHEIFEGWTWMHASVNGHVGWVSTSQLGRHGSQPASCRINSPNTEVRNTPAGLAQGVISTGANFSQAKPGAVRSGNFEWVLGTIGGTAGWGGHNGWYGRLMWVATSQIPRSCWR